MPEIPILSLLVTTALNLSTHIIHSRAQVLLLSVGIDLWIGYPQSGNQAGIGSVFGLLTEKENA